MPHNLLSTRVTMESRMRAVLYNVIVLMNVKHNIWVKYDFKQATVVNWPGDEARPSVPPTVGFETHPALWNAACASRNDDAGSFRSGKNQVHTGADAGNDGLRRTAARDAHEPEGDYSTSDVRSPGSRLKPLVWWYLLNSLEENSQSKEGE